jgi:SAM-dependent methyltransferase
MKNYSNYDNFAWVYDKHWGDYAQYILPALERLVFPYLSAKANILDLCCGTGQLAQILTARGYQVTGLDGSEEMLHFARKEAPAAKFIKADARFFKLPVVYHAVISVFDSLNHIMTPEELISVFHNMFAALQEDGLFFFDLNTEDGYKACWNDNFGIVEADHVCVIRSSYRAEEGIAQFDATIFRQQEGWDRSDVTLLQRCYSEANVRSALETAGFDRIQTYAYDEQKGLGGLSKRSERALFLCRKPTQNSR